MLDFSGWWDNWSWSGILSGKVPSWAAPGAMLGALTGAGLLATSWFSLGVFSQAWMQWAWLLLPVAAVLIDALTDALSERENAILAYGHAILLAGVLALSALELTDPESRRAFAVIAPCVAAGSAPLLLRIWAATLYARDMIEFSARSAEKVRAALAGTTDALVARVERLDGDEVELVTLGAGAAQRLRARAIAIYRRPFLTVGECFLLEQPELGELESSEGYRAGARFRRVRSITNVQWLTKDPERWMALSFDDEVRAGVVMIVLHHTAVTGASLVLAAVWSPG